MHPAASALALLALAALSISAWGWGRMVLRAAGGESASGAAYPAAVGLAALAAAGGWLNLAGAAYPPALWGLLAVGWVAALRRARAIAPDAPRLASDPALLLPTLAIAAAALALAAFLLPGGAFNPIDDFGLYIPRALRMLQSGSLGGNPFDSLGMDSLGAHAFLQALTQLALPLEFFNAYDAVLAAVLAMALVAESGRALRAGTPVVLAALAALALVPPFQVNVSAVYAIAAFVLALVPALSAPLAPQAAAWPALWRRAAPAGLLVAATAASKATALVFLLPAAGFLFALLALAEGWRRAWRPALAVAAWSALFISPWIALQAANYGRWLGRALGGGGAGGPSAFLGGSEFRWAETVMQFNAIALIVLAGALLGGFRALRAKDDPARPRALVLAALCGAAVVAYAIGTRLPLDIYHAWRYSAPMMLAGTAAAVLLIGRALPRIASGAAALAVPVALAALVPGLTSFRVHAAVAHRSVLAFPSQDMPQFSVLTAWGLGEGVREWTRAAQARVPAGAPILALIDCPHELLFARNPVLVASELGLTAPWLALPVEADAAQVRRFLSRYGVKYVIWQPASRVKLEQGLLEQLVDPANTAARLSAKDLLAFRKALERLTLASRIVHAEEGLLVVDVGG